MDLGGLALVPFSCKWLQLVDSHGP